MSSSTSGTPQHVIYKGLPPESAMYFSRQRAMFDKEKREKMTTVDAVNIKPIQRIDVHKITHLRDFVKNPPSVHNEFRRIRYNVSRRPRVNKERSQAQQDTNKTTSATQEHHITSFRPTYSRFVADDEYAIVDNVRSTTSPDTAFAFHVAGPREKLMWNPGEVVAAVVTCGGVAPGLNNVIQELFYCLHYNYGVDTVYGIRSGYRGFWQPQYQPWLPLTPDIVEKLHEEGGSMLGSSRGGFDAVKMVNALEVYGVNQVYVIGGDGTHRGAWELHSEATRRGIKLAVACIPKTIDNDIGTIDRSFGFNTAVAEARKAILSAAVSAQSTANGVAIVKLMGRHAGYIAAHATISARSVDACLIPEVPMSLHGAGGFLRHIQRITEQRGHSVVVLAEGAGQEWIEQGHLDVQYDSSLHNSNLTSQQVNDDRAYEEAKAKLHTGGSATHRTDASGNVLLEDVGTFLEREVQNCVKIRGKPVTTIYNDPSYTVRSIPADAEDAVFCLHLASNAVHGAMAGYTGFSTGTVNNRFVMIPIEVIVNSSPAYMNPKGTTWQTVLNLTHQPHIADDEEEEEDDRSAQQPAEVLAKL